MTGNRGAFGGESVPMVGHYRIPERNGAGGRGEVYGVRDKHLGWYVAGRVLPGSVRADDTLIGMRFRKEALTLSKPNCTRIAGGYNCATWDGWTFQS